MVERKYAFKNLRRYGDGGGKWLRQEGSQPTIFSRESSLRLSHRDLCSRDKGLGPFYPQPMARSQGQNNAPESRQMGLPDEGFWFKHHQLLREADGGGAKHQ